MENFCKFMFGIAIVILYTIIPIPHNDEKEETLDYFYEEIIEELPTSELVVIIENKDPDHDLCFTLSRGTQYQPVPEQCNSDPLHTANMTKVNLQQLKQGKQKICAFSYDVIEKYGLKMGERFDIWDRHGRYLGRFKFCDHMNPRINDTCDMMIHPDSQAKFYKDIEIKRVKKGC